MAVIGSSSEVWVGPDRGPPNRAAPVRIEMLLYFTLSILPPARSGQTVLGNCPIPRELNAYGNSTPPLISLGLLAQVCKNTHRGCRFAHLGYPYNPYTRQEPSGLLAELGESVVEARDVEAAGNLL